MRWLDSITNSMDMNLSELQKTVEDRRGRCASIHRVILHCRQNLYHLSPQGNPQIVELEFQFSLTPELKLMLLPQKLPQPTVLTAWMEPVRTQSTGGWLWSGMTGQSEK